MDLSALDDNHEKWSVTIPSLTTYNKKYYINGSLGSLHQTSNKDGFCVTIIDLLETATSIAEFQVSTSPKTRASHLQFSRWCKRNPAYTTVYKYVNNLFPDSDLPISFLIPLINKAFETTKPIIAFIYLLNEFFWWTKSDSNSLKFLEKEEPRNWVYLLEILSDKLPFNEDIDDLNETNSIFDGFYKLSRDKWIGSHYQMGDFKLFHPFIYKQAKKWKKKQLRTKVMVMF